VAAWRRDTASTGVGFVIGDQNAALGTHVADRATATCGQSWTTRPDNSSAPPAALGDVVSVVVSSQITKSGPVISDDTVEVVLVLTDPGFEADPGHAGSGTVIGIVCGGGDSPTT
jgi:hypothetical protein